MYRSRGRKCNLRERRWALGPEPALLFHTHYHQFQKHSKWKMKLYTGNVQNNQFRSPCVYVLLIVTLESISLNYMVCIFGVCPRTVMEADHPRPHLCRPLSPVRSRLSWETAREYDFSIKWAALSLAAVWEHKFRFISFHLLHSSVRGGTWRLFTESSHHVQCKSCLSERRRTSTPPPPAFSFNLSLPPLVLWAPSYFPLSD